MGVTEEAGKAVGAVTDAMRSVPLAIALLVVNIVFLGSPLMCSERLREQCRRAQQDPDRTDQQTGYRHQGLQAGARKGQPMTYNRIVISFGPWLYIVAPPANRFRHVSMRSTKPAEWWNTSPTRCAHAAFRSRPIMTMSQQKQDENLKRIVDFHNAQARDSDVSVHFNAFDTKAHGVEVCYCRRRRWRPKCRRRSPHAGFTDRGPKHRPELYFLKSHLGTGDFDRDMLLRQSG